MMLFGKRNHCNEHRNSRHIYLRCFFPGFANVVLMSVNCTLKQIKQLYKVKNSSFYNQVFRSYKDMLMMQAYPVELRGRKRALP